MKKLIIGFAVIGSLTFVGAAGRALAADPPAAGGADKAAAGGGGDDANTTYKAKTVYDFEDDMVEGDLQRPDGELVNAHEEDRALQPHRDPQRLHSGDVEDPGRHLIRMGTLDRVPKPSRDGLRRAKLASARRDLGTLSVIRRFFFHRTQ